MSFEEEVEKLEQQSLEQTGLFEKMLHQAEETNGKMDKLILLMKELLKKIGE